MQDRPTKTAPTSLAPRHRPAHAAQPRCHGPLDPQPGRTRQRADAAERPLLRSARERRAHHCRSDANRTGRSRLYLDAGNPQRRTGRRLEMRHQGGPYRRRPHRAAALACRTHLASSFQPGGRYPSRRRPSNPMAQAFTAKGFEPIPTPRALETAEIPGIVEQYAQGARNALAAGFDGVEVHAANGYLIDQFLRDGPTSAPTPMAAASRIALGFLLEVVDAVTAVAGAERTGVRISPQNTQNDIADSDPQTLFNYVAERLSARSRLSARHRRRYIRHSRSSFRLHGQATVRRGGHRQ